MSKIQNLAIQQYNNQSHFNGRKIKGGAVRWDTPNFIKRFEDYFGVVMSAPKSSNYNNKLFN